MMRELPPDEIPSDDTWSRRVILADDDETLRGLIAGVLRADGLEVIEAADGRQLLDAFERHLLSGAGGSDAVVIVADIQMPSLSGLDVLAILRCAAIPTRVILLTAFGDAETHAEARELGVSGVFDKPVDLDDLRAAVHAAATA
jgi:DNA-binding response OmpR family regulator